MNKQVIFASAGAFLLGALVGGYIVDKHHKHKFVDGYDFGYETAVTNLVPVQLGWVEQCMYKKRTIIHKFIIDCEVVGYDNLCMIDKLVVLFLAEIAPLLRKFNGENTEH